MRTRTGAYFFSVNPAVSDEAAKRIRRQIRSWRLHLRSGSTLGDLAREINPIVRGWVNYYGRFCKSELIYILNGINHYLMRWAMQKFKRLRRHRQRAWERLGYVQPVPEPVRALAVRIAAMRLGDGSRVNREVHARF